PGDLRITNDTLMSTVYRYPVPVVDFGLDETEYIEDVSLDIDAGYHAAYLYQWQDTAWHNSVYTATESGLYHAKVTDTRTQCYDRDSVMVFLIYGDVGVTWTDMQENGCTGEFDQVKVRITNLGPSVIGSSAPIYVACEVNGSRVTIDTLRRTVNFNPGASLDLTLSGSVVISTGGESRISFYTLYTQDKKPGNDTLTSFFDALPAPVIDFGDVNGNLTVDLPYVLDAGVGHQSYLWQDNSTNQTYNVTVKGQYRVTVTGTNDCQTTKTVLVNMQSSVNDPVSSDLYVYPNPNQGMFRIKMTEYVGEATIRILNNNGQVVYLRTLTSEELNHGMIDVQSLSEGIYYLLLQTKDGLLKGKIVIN
ncbi:MAG TPA: T9SS type A sorting domain-containing protein, partial [Bacteroidales bacterium]|nr:T9SS type A sorting domain-containing protein [Bacteroidales bacterium]